MANIPIDTPSQDSPGGIAPAQIYLQPIAAPSILGMFGLAGATFMVAAHLAGWYGHANSGIFLFPFAAMFGGLAQFLAAMWAFKARDGVATAVHGTWGSFWIGFGILYVIFALSGGRFGTPAMGPGVLFPELGYWFIVTAAVSWMCAVASLGENLATFLVMVFFGAASSLEAIALLGGFGAVQLAAAYCFIVGSIIAWYTASALMFEESFGHSVLGVRKIRRIRPISAGAGEPGVIRGQ